MRRQREMIGKLEREHGSGVRDQKKKGLGRGRRVDFGRRGLDGNREQGTENRDSAIIPN